MFETQRDSVSLTLIYMTEAINSKACLSRGTDSIRELACFL